MAEKRIAPIRINKANELLLMALVDKGDYGSLAEAANAKIKDNSDYQSIDDRLKRCVAECLQYKNSCRKLEDVVLSQQLTIDRLTTRSDVEEGLIVKN